MGAVMEDIKDEFHGVGGSYVVGADGKRKLVARTKDTSDPKHDDNLKRAEAEAKANKAKKGE